MLFNISGANIDQQSDCLNGFIWCWTPWGCGGYICDYYAYHVYFKCQLPYKYINVLWYKSNNRLVLKHKMAWSFSSLIFKHGFEESKNAPNTKDTYY